MSDRGEHPKNAGDRGFGHGDQITVELSNIDADVSQTNADGELIRGHFVDFVGDGTVERTDDGTGYTGSYEAVLKHSAAEGDDVTIHNRGVVRVAESGHSFPVIDSFNNGDELIVLR